MLALGAANTTGAVLFGVLYAVAGANRLSQAAFVVCLVTLVVLVTVMWVRMESRHRDLHALARIGRATAGLLMVVIAIPIVVLMPLFWLDTQLPPEAGLTPLLGPIMALVLIALALVALTNVLGGASIAIRAAVGRNRR